MRIIIVFVLLLCEGLGNDDMIIKTKNGKIRGVKLTSEQGNSFYSFRGIPYAEPPVGNLRFKPPVDAKPWGDNILDATQDGPDCPQVVYIGNKFSGQEDCLVLNVYTGQLPNEDQFKPRAVMVFIHGGGFIFGTGSSSFYNPKSLMDKNIVLVTFNYRLGPLGFLNTADEHSPGNYGLLDQTKALQWVKLNIAEYGGDPDKITIFGQSAGGASVVYHMISSLSKGLFHRAITMSGSSLSVWAFKADPLEPAKMLGRKLNCPVDDNEKLVKCLRDIPAKEITAEGFNLNNGFLPVLFVPSVDNNFINDNPLHLLSSGKINKDIAFMSGITKDEGAMYYAVYNPNSLPLNINEVKRYIQELLGTSLPTENAVKLVQERYFDGVDISNEKEMRKKLTEMFSHGAFAMSHYETTYLVSNHEIETFAYQYDYAAPFSITQDLGIKEVFGVAHFDDMYMLFEGMFSSVNMTEKDKKMKTTYQTLLTNFAKYGHPTDKSSDLKFLKWDPVRENKMTIYHVDDPMRTDVYNIHDDDLYTLWTHDIPEAINSDLSKSKDELIPIDRTWTSQMKRNIIFFLNTILKFWSRL